MYAGIKLQRPIFEIGFKSCLYGEKALAVAQAADEISADFGIQIILSPQYVDIAKIAEQTENLLVFAQHCDPLEPGRGVGQILPEAIKAAGAVGVMLNHAEKKMSLSDLAQTIQRADEVGLLTMVCADTPDQAMAIAQLCPNIIFTEPPALIGSGSWASHKDAAHYVLQCVQKIKKVDPRIIVLAGAGISHGEDVRQIIGDGADGTGACSAIVKAKNPSAMITEMVKATKETWLSLGQQT